MYKPPENNNRVKSIKSKFENIESQKEQGFCTPKKSSNDKERLSRQYSDPLKRNIKRTPAFRADKSLDKKNGCNRRTLFENKVKQFNSVKYNNIEKSSASMNVDIVQNSDQFSSKYMLNSAVPSEVNKTDSKMFKSPKRPTFVKSKSSHDFQYIRSKFDKDRFVPTKEISPLSNGFVDDTNDNEIENNSDDDLKLKNIDLSLLYTEPIPKSLRNKNINESSNKSNTETCCESNINNIYSKSTLQLTDNDKREFLESLKQVLQQDGLTDTLKIALKRPLPTGPAPEKPPRTFKHLVESVLSDRLERNSSFLHEKKTASKKAGKRGDPKYMLNKLQTALKNNQLRARKQQKVEVSTTSGEDSDDSVLFQSKSCRSLPKPPVNDNITQSRAESLLSEFNCFNSFGCANPAYERIKEPSSSFFIGVESDPIYSEPMQHKRDKDENKNVRNSLYYMSTALISDNDQAEIGNEALPSFQNAMTSKMDELKLDHSDCLLKQISAENSSLSSFTSDLDSNPSPVADDSNGKIRCLIENFEKIDRSSLKRIQGSSDSGTRVEALKNTLKMTLDRTFKNEASVSDCRDSDSEKQFADSKVAGIVAKFQTYQRTTPKYQKPNICKDTLFYCCLVIEKVQDCAQIKFKFPSNVEIPRDIEHLCFPENPNSPPLEGCSAAQTYSLLITSDTGERTYGYCRRVLPEGSTHCLPLAYCILSKYRAPMFYKKILLELESRHGIQNRFRDELISQFYCKKFPKPGESITINLSLIEPRGGNEENKTFEDSLDLASYVHVNKTGEYGSLNTTKRTSIYVSESDVQERCLSPSFVAYEGNKTELILTLHVDTRYEDTDLKRLHKLPPDILLKIFSSLLLERKVILISSSMSDLSSCVDSLQSILYPFTWYHTFIPILPESLWDIVESPTPVVCGVLSVEAFKDRRIENGIVVNLDTKSVLVEEGDEMKILSGSMQKVWRQFIKLANNTQSLEYVYSVYLADAYLYVFICCMKNYKDFIADGQFLKEEFIKKAKTKGIRRFLKMFTETCMFHAFVDAALNNSESLVIFDKKIELYGSDESLIILDKLIDWNGVAS